MSAFKITKDCPIIKNIVTANNTYNFISSDSEELYKKNLSELKEDWYYYNKVIKYNYNSWGYRTKEFKDLKEDFFISFGCSFTEGLGLLEEDMWVNKLSKLFDVDVFNLSQGGSGVDFSTTNTILLIDYLRKCKRTPKFVVYQLSFDARTTFTLKVNENNETNLYFKLFSPSYTSDINDESLKDYVSWYFKSFVDNGGELIKQSNISLMICKNMWEMMDVPVIFWTYGEDFTNEYSYLFNHNIKYKIIRDTTNVKARDCAHNGHLAQDLIVNELKNDILLW